MTPELESRADYCAFAEFADRSIQCAGWKLVQEFNGLIPAPKASDKPAGERAQWDRIPAEFMEKLYAKRISGRSTRFVSLCGFCLHATACFEKPVAKS
jgi:hypothetical protein